MEHAGPRRHGIPSDPQHVAATSRSRLEPRHHDTPRRHRRHGYGSGESRDQSPRPPRDPHRRSAKRHHIHPADHLHLVRSNPSARRARRKPASHRHSAGRHRPQASDRNSHWTASDESCRDGSRRATSAHPRRGNRQQLRWRELIQLRNRPQLHVGRSLQHRSRHGSRPTRRNSRDRLHRHVRRRRFPLGRRRRHTHSSQLHSRRHMAARHRPSHSRGRAARNRSTSASDLGPITLPTLYLIAGVSDSPASFLSKSRPRSA